MKYVPTDIKTYREIGQLYKKKGLEGVKAFVNGKKPNFDVQPRVENGRTLVPFRALGEAFGALINWDAATQTVSFEKGDTLVQLPIGQTIALVNGQQYQLDVAAFIDNGRTLVPLRFIMEALNAKVDYLPDTQMVIVNEE
ncbi:MAG: copper amine oxidase N-terminal domain-containing protein [Thermoanaerobacteraceae bacterium]|nr:copper amine oxidase N-terminal domain-containing protein [Thermoanaerobacteraceae bacterium]